MFQRIVVVAGLAFVAVAAVSGQAVSRPRTGQAGASTVVAPPVATVAAQRAVIDKYCVGCHNLRVKAGGLALDELDLAKLSGSAEVVEKVALKLRAGLMPPPRMPRPDRATLDGLIGWLEN